MGLATPVFLKRMGPAVSVAIVERGEPYAEVGFL